MVTLDEALITLGFNKPTPILRPKRKSSSRTNSQREDPSSSNPSSDSYAQTLNSQKDIVRRKDELLVPWGIRNGEVETNRGEVAHILDAAMADRKPAIDLLARTSLFGGPYGFNQAPNLLHLDSTTHDNFDKHNSVAFFLSTGSVKALHDTLVRRDARRVQYVKEGVEWTDLVERDDVLKSWTDALDPHEKPVLKYEVISFHYQRFGILVKGVPGRSIHDMLPDGRHTSKHYLAYPNGDILVRDEGSQETCRMEPFPLVTSRTNAEKPHPFALLLNALSKYRFFLLHGGDPAVLSALNKEIIKKNSELAELVLNDPALQEWEARNNSTPPSLPRPIAPRRTSSPSIINETATSSSTSDSRMSSTGGPKRGSENGSSGSRKSSRRDQPSRGGGGGSGGGSDGSGRGGTRRTQSEPSARGSTSAARSTRNSTTGQGASGGAVEEGETEHGYGHGDVSVSSRARDLRRRGGWRRRGIIRWTQEVFACAELDASRATGIDNIGITYEKSDECKNVIDMSSVTGISNISVTYEKSDECKNVVDMSSAPSLGNGVNLSRLPSSSSGTEETVLRFRSPKYENMLGFASAARRGYSGRQKDSRVAPYSDTGPADVSATVGNSIKKRGYINPDGRAPADELSGVAQPTRKALSTKSRNTRDRRIEAPPSSAKTAEAGIRGREQKRLRER